MTETETYRFTDGTAHGGRGGAERHTVDGRNGHDWWTEDGSWSGWWWSTDTDPADGRNNEWTDAEEAVDAANAHVRGEPTDNWWGELTGGMAVGETRRGHRDGDLSSEAWSFNRHA